MGVSQTKVKRKDLVCIFLFLLYIIANQSGKLVPNASGIIVKGFVFLPLLVSVVYYFYVRSHRRTRCNQEFGNRYIGSLLVPYFALIFIATAIAAVFNPTYISIYGISYWTRLVSNLLQRLSPLVLVYCVLLNNKEHCLDCLVKALELDGLIVIGSAVLKVGLIETLKGFIYPLGFAAGAVGSNCLEIHEATYVIGYLLLYYLFFHDNRKRDRYHIVILIFLFLIGGKRIGFAAFVVSFLFALFFKRFITRRTLLFIAACGTIICFGYLALIYSGSLIDFFNRHGINSMGRNLIWPYFTRRSSFGIDYFGAGWASTSKMLENLDQSEVYYMAAVRGIHNDFLKLYFEFGFWGFLGWLVYSLLYVPVKMNKFFGQQSCRIYIVCIIFAFITYLTDNTEQYPLFQAVLYLFPLFGGIRKQVLIDLEKT